MRLILFLILLVLIIGALPTWPYSAGWGILPEWRFRPRSTDRIACRSSSIDIALYALLE
jgi:Protein of unknown function (DUF3309)